jgi:alpha-beta hydrolase superfamily lysophospholipase
MSLPPLFPDVLQEETWQEMSDGAAIRVLEFRPATQGNPEEPVIVFVPGAISPLPLWLAILEVLTARFPVVYVETREKNSARLPDVRKVDFGMDRVREDLKEVLVEKVPEDRPHCLVGASFGATVILEHLAEGARSPLATILIAPNSDFRVPAWLLIPVRLIPVSLYFAVKPVLKWYYGNVLVDVEKEPEQAARHKEMIDSADFLRLKSAALAIQSYSGWKTFPKITEPVLVVTGESDTLHDLSKVERIVSAVPNARLTMMESDRATHSSEFGVLVLETIEETLRSRQ